MLLFNGNYLFLFGPTAEGVMIKTGDYTPHPPEVKG